MTKEIRIGSRDSKMALYQAERVQALIQAAAPGTACRIVPFRSAGDLDQTRRLDDDRAQGIFTDRLRDALLAGEADVCVHSLKDLPYGADADCPVTVCLRRDDPREALVLPLAGKAGGAEAIKGPIGCSCGRRRLQIRKMLPSVKTKDVRGAVPHRIEQMERGDFGGLLLAMAGLDRLGLAPYAARIYSAEEIVPAAGQGVVALQSRRGERYDFFENLHDADAARTSAAERRLEEILTERQAGVAAAYARIAGTEMYLIGLLGEEGTGALIRQELSGPAAGGETLAAQLAEILIQKGKENGFA
jgi:hydroxymethylbilane synthase